MQRQREQAEERTNLAAAASKGLGEDKTAIQTDTSTPKLEQVTLPPAPGQGLTETAPAATTPGATTKKTEPAAPHVNPREETAPPPAPVTRPREVETNKKKGKKGANEP
jgi:hypothetical protein